MAWLFLYMLFAISIILTDKDAVIAQTATSTEIIKNKIDSRNNDIDKLEKEIAEYQKELDTLSKKENSLASTVKSLELTQKKLEADIRITEDKIYNKNMEIRKLSSQISDQEEKIGDDKRIIFHSLTEIAKQNDTSAFETIMKSESISSAMDNAFKLGELQGNILARIDELKILKTDLENNKKSTEKAKTELTRLGNQLKDQKEITLSNKAEQNALLKETKQSEKQYQQMMAEKKKLKDEFESEIMTLEAQLKNNVDASLLPKIGKGILSWPLAKVKITQYFGNTDFAVSNPQIYNGKGHNGIDFAASIGTPVLSAGPGTVAGTGNTDVIRGCYSYGKWVMVNHTNGLSTIYGHLSLVSAKKGQYVSAGDVIGYSGNTGYSVGPHLHFTVLATQGAQILKLSSGQSRRCIGAVIPVANFNAYLNPMSYL